MSLTIVPTEVLGIKHKQFLAKQKAKCLKDPEAFVNQRDAILELITNKVVDDLYVTLQALLGTGLVSGLDPAYQPKGCCYPPQEINDRIIEVVGLLAEGLNKIRYSMPSSISKLY